MSFLAAVVQLNCTGDEEANLVQVEALVRRAAGYGAQLVATPENTNYLGPHDEKVRRAEPIGGPLTQRMGTLARELGIYLLMGSFNEAAGDPQRCANTSVLFDPHGAVTASYRKIHLFDADVSSSVRFRETDTAVPGTEPVVAQTRLGALGLSICYDLRFPELYRALVDQGAELLAVPSAFTATTGKAHWMPLLRARAIETQCWVLAPGQVGAHGDGGLRESHGHSCIIDPWGTVVAEAGDGPGLALAEIDLAKVAEVRRGMPIVNHRRL